MIMETTEYQSEEMSHHDSTGVKLELNDRFSFSGRMVRKHKSSSSPLNFATSVEDYEMHGPPSKKPKTPRDPMSHRIIEKRRRDRMNNCLADLSRLIPANYMKQGQGRIEKTEIIEMAIRHIKHLQNVHRSIVSQGQCCAEKFYLGFKECEAETIRYFVECEGLDSKDQFCMRVISHLEAASQKYITANQNCEYRKEETNTDDKGNITSAISSECDISKPQNLKSEMTPQSVPDMLAPSHESITSATSKQLRNLLSHGNSGFEQIDSGNGSCADSLGPFSSNESYVSTNQHEDGGSLLGGAESDSHYRNHGSSDGSSSSSSSKDSKFTNYKFKHDITKRFSQEEKYSIDPSASSHHERIHEHDSNIYEKHSHSHEKHSLDKHGHCYEKHEKLSGKLKRKMVRSKSPSSSSDSTIYPTSEHSSNGNGGDMSSIQCRTAENDLVTAAVPLPAFVLHPQGTHYLPLTIQPSCFQNALPQLDRLQQPLVFHPISILVNFSAPGMVIQNAEAFVSSANPLTSFPGNMCSNAGPLINNSGNNNSGGSNGRENSGSHNSSGNHNSLNISSGSLSSSSGSPTSIGNNGNMNCNPASSSVNSCGSLPPHSRVVTPTNNTSGAITTIVSTNTTPVINTSMSHNTMQLNTHIPPVLLNGGVSGSEHHLVVSLPGSSVNTTTPSINTNNSNNNNNVNLNTNGIPHHTIPPPPPLHSPHPHHLPPHTTNTNNNNPNSNTNMNTTSSHLKMEDRSDNSSNVVSSSHCYPIL